MHGYLTRDGIDPKEFLRDRRARARAVRHGRAARRRRDGRRVPARRAIRRHARRRHQIVRSRKLLIATGVCDNLPEIDGIRELYGRSVFHCPYCDGWEVRDQPIAIYGRGDRGLGLSLELTGVEPRPRALHRRAVGDRRRRARAARAQRHRAARGPRRRAARAATAILERIVFATGDDAGAARAVLHDRTVAALRSSRSISAAR